MSGESCALCGELIQDENIVALSEEYFFHDSCWGQHEYDQGVDAQLKERDS